MRGDGVHSAEAVRNATARIESAAWIGHAAAMPVLPFQKLTAVRIMAHPDRPAPGPGDEAIHAAHLAYLGALVRRGTILVNGPFASVDEPRLRGMSLYTVGPEEARRLANEDPAVRAGWFEIVLDEWMFRAIPRTIGDRVDLEIDVPFDPEGSPADAGPDLPPA